jgi:hypothetical protein
VVDMDIGRQEKHKSPGIDQIHAQIFITGGRTIYPEITIFLILFGIGGTG